MNFKNLLLAAVLFFVAHSAQAMHSTVTIHTNSYPTASILPLYLRQLPLMRQSVIRPIIITLIGQPPIIMMIITGIIMIRQ